MSIANRLRTIERTAGAMRCPRCGANVIPECHPAASPSIADLIRQAREAAGLGDGRAITVADAPSTGSTTP